MALEFADVMAQLATDAGPFVKVATSFTVNKRAWTGQAVATPHALYLVKVAEVQNAHAYGGGLVGVLLAAAFTKPETMSTCTVADLPAAVRAQVDPKGKLATRDVVIIPRATVSLVKTSMWGNLTLHVGSEVFTATAGMFGKGKVMQGLEGMGWVLNRQVVPEAAPMHDLRTPEAAEKAKGKPVWQKALLVLAAVVILLVVLLIVAAVNSQ